MTENTNNIPETFLNQVKEALESIYDYPTLQRHVFAKKLQADSPGNRDNPAHQVRRLLVEAIEKLNPGNHEGARSGTKRIYNLLHLHYVGGMTIQEVALELGVSARQAYRDLKKGQDSVSSILWYKLGGQNIETTQSMNTLSSIQTEVTRLNASAQWINLNQLLSGISNALTPLKEQYNVEISILISPDARMSSNSTIARQIIMNLLSQTIQQNPVRVDIYLEETDKYFILNMDCERALENTNLSPVVMQLAQQLKWKIEQTPQSARILMQRLDTTILLIDDNEGLVDLMKHYLGEQSYQVMTAFNGIEGLKLAREAKPDVIIMDIMMPEMDGWELLQHFRTIPDTCEIPIIVCSVINDPELAFSLGVSKFITKPVDKDKLFQALAELNL